MSPRPSPRASSTAVSRAALVLGVALLPTLAADDLGDLAPPLPIAIEGQTAYVVRGTTLGEAIHMFDLRVTSGRLLDVEGKVLEYRADPGRILLNGVEATHDAELAPGDAIEVADGVDRTEGTHRVVTALPGLRPGNPQYTLGASKVLRVTVEGRVSGKVVSVEYRPVGRTKRPPEVALTFDDGPWPRTTRAVLAILERMHVRATFFMVGYLVERYSGIVRAVRDVGMTIGNHSWDHPYLRPFAKLEPHRIRWEMADTSELLRKRFGVRVGLFRAPGGSWNGRVVHTADDLGLRLVQWSVDPHDYARGMTADRLVRSVLRSVRPGSIVLLHDGGGDRSATVRALPRIVRGIRRMGLKLVALEP